MAVTVTETAAREILAIIRDKDLDAEAIRLRVGVKGGGCSGFSYLLDLTEKQRDTDEVWELTYQFAPAESAAAGSGGNVGVVTCESFTLRVICDPKSYLYLNGTVIDFREEMMGRGFVFNNPNATTTCGCGSSFAV